MPLNPRDDIMAILQSRYHMLALAMQSWRLARTPSERSMARCRIDLHAEFLIDILADLDEYDTRLCEGSHVPDDDGSVPDPDESAEPADD